MSEPTGREHVTPVAITATSATERAVFRKCRRQWFLSVVHGLETMEGNLNFWLGELVHSGLEEYYKGIQGGLPHDVAANLALAAYEDKYLEAFEPLAAQWRAVWQLARPIYEDMGVLGYDMLAGYFEREQRQPLVDEVEQVEERLFVPIVDNGEVIGWLAVRTDLVGRRHGLLAAIDHKTAGSKLASSMLDIDDQGTSEVFAVWRDMGEFPEKFIYNALLKKQPLPPKPVKGTKLEPVKLSKAKGQPTTYALYLAEIARLGLDRANYEDVLERLLEDEDLDETPFYYREETFRTPGQMDEFERNLLEEFKDMRAVAAEPQRAYPSPSQFACPTCPVKQACFAIMDGSDPGHVITTQYVIGESRYSPPALPPNGGIVGDPDTEDR